MHRKDLITAHNITPNTYGQVIYFCYSGSISQGVYIKDVLHDARMIANGHERVLDYYQSVQLKLPSPRDKVFQISCDNLTKAELALAVCKFVIPHLRGCGEPVAKGRSERRSTSGHVQMNGIKLVSVVDLGDGYAQVKLEGL